MPVDFSESSQAAYDYALRLADQFDSRVRLLHVIEDKTSPDFKPSSISLNRSATTAAAKRKLVEFAQSGSPVHVSVSPDVRVGDPSEQIIHAADHNGADLIVIPTHGRTGLKRVLMGSVAEKVVRHAPCPVLVLRGRKVELMVTRKIDHDKEKEPV